MTGIRFVCQKKLSYSAKVENSWDLNEGAKAVKRKKKEIKKKHHSFFEGMAIIYQSIIEWSQGFQGFIVKGHYDTAKLPGHA